MRELSLSVYGREGHGQGLWQVAAAMVCRGLCWCANKASRPIMVTPTSPACCWMPRSLPARPLCPAGKPLHYKGVRLHRIVKGFLVQGGDVVKVRSAPRPVWVEMVIVWVPLPAGQGQLLCSLLTCRNASACSSCTQPACCPAPLLPNCYRVTVQQGTASTAASSRTNLRRSSSSAQPALPAVA